MLFRSKLERLRHDDPRLDEQKLSYVMVEEAARELETDTVIGRKNEEVRSRPEAAVKGITPSQPAPAASPRPIRSDTNQSKEGSGGLFGFIKRIFSSDSTKKDEESKPRKRSDGRGRDGDRNRNRNRNRVERGQRNQSSERVEKSSEAADSITNRQNRQENRNRNREERQAQQERVDSASVNASSERTGNDTEQENTNDERRRGRNRRGRGRNRGERSERMEQSGSTQTESSPEFPMGLGGRSASMPLSQIVRSLDRKSTRLNSSH